MNKNNYENPDKHIFYCDKSDWYVEKYGEKNWSKGWGWVVEFWQRVREEKMAREDFDFSEFVFPKFFKHSFWLGPEERKFVKDVNFEKSLFLDEADLMQIHFKNKCNFKSCVFIDSAILTGSVFSNGCAFINSKFIGHAEFTGVKFLNSIRFNGVCFSSKTRFIQTQFKHSTSFHEAEFLGRTIFHQNEFEHSISFSKALFKNHIEFFEVKFQGSVEFYRTEFRGDSDWINVLWDTNRLSYVPSFRSTYFRPDKHAVFSDWEIKSSVSFDGIVFPEEFIFQQFNFEGISFKHCNLTKVKFSNCLFKKDKGRIVFGNDNIKDYKKTFLNHPEWDDFRVYKDLSNTYRQLKKNLMDAKDWEDAGDAYRSEMYFTRKLRWQEFKGGQRHKIINWCIMGLHEHLSGYQQSIALPFLWLMVVLTVSPMLIFITGFFHQPCYSNIVCWDQLVQAGITSFNAALPIAGKISIEGYPKTLYFYLLFERLFSVVLITFFVLAMRARLRQ